MSAFALAREAAALAPLAAQFAKMGFPPGRTLPAGPGHLLCMPRRNESDIALAARADGAFVMVAGVLFANGVTGQAAAETLLARFDGSPRSLEGEDFGQYAIVAGTAETVCILNDTTGLFQVFVDPARGLAASSFLALATTLTAPRLNTQAAYEYLFNGTPLGNDTLAAGVSLLPKGAALAMERGGVRIIARETPPPRAPAGAPLEACAAALADVARIVAAAFPDRLVAALSGGYDSRLVVAALRQAGARPQLFVYGEEEEADVRIARQIAAALGLPLRVDARREAPIPDPQTAAAGIAHRFHVSDGHSWGGIFGDDNEEREQDLRGGAGRIHLSGGGGEIFRDFFMMPDRPFAAERLVETFYCAFDPRTVTARFDARAYRDAIAAKLRALIPSPVFTRADIEALYPAFRCRAWFGREVTLNTMGGRALLPLLAAPVVAAAARVPYAAKRFGRFEAALIARLDPEIARFPSSYGHAFTASPPWALRLDHALTYARTPWFRSRMFGLRARLRTPPADWGGWLGRGVLAAALPGPWDAATALVRPERLTSRVQFARAATLEYLARQIGARVG